MCQALVVYQSNGMVLFGEIGGSKLLMGNNELLQYVLTRAKQEIMERYFYCFGSKPRASGVRP